MGGDAVRKEFLIELRHAFAIAKKEDLVIKEKATGADDSKKKKKSAEAVVGI